MHTIPLCANCKEAHTADSKLCEIYQAKLNPRQHADEPYHSTDSYGFQC
jgi:hypothetical protein